MNTSDSFVELARYYDPIMEDVNYDRWYHITSELGSMLDSPFLHVDAACGTARLARRLKRAKWNTFGFDLSVSMLRESRRNKPVVPSFSADFCALPLKGSVDYITCLFDSINFLLDEEAVFRAISEWATALREGGLLYFDIVTERMVLDHFAGQNWTERNGRIHTTWDCEYHKDTATCETRIQINHGEVHVLRERVYEVDRIQAALNNAGFETLGVYDADFWSEVRKSSARIDFVAVKGDAKPYRRKFNDVRDRLRETMH